jgi:hypothetical protein
MGELYLFTFTITQSYHSIGAARCKRGIVIITFDTLNYMQNVK